MNDGATLATSGNNGLDHPVIASATLDGTTFVVQGTAVANATVEVYLADPGAGDTVSGVSFGEGREYLGTATVDGSGNFTLTLATVPASVTSSRSVTAIAIEADGDTSEFGQGEAINAVPIPTNDAFTTAEDTPLNADVAGNDADADADTLVYNLVTGPTNGLITLNADGTFSFTPNANFNGSDSFTYRVNDGAASAEATASITITPVNDSPVGADDAFTTNKNVALVATVRVQANDTDVDGDVLTVDPTPVVGPTNGTLSLDAAGTFVYTPNANFVGNDSFIYSVLDGAGGTSTATVVVSVMDGNTAPTVAGPVNVAFDEDTPTQTIDALAGAADVDGDALNITGLVVVSGDASGVTFSGTTATVDPSAYELASGTDETIELQYNIEDGQGGSVRQSATIVIHGVNDIPVAGNDTFVVDEGGTLNVTTPAVFANDSDADGTVDQGDVSVQPLHGRLIWNSDGTFTYEHDGSETTSDSFEYFIVDGDGGRATAAVSLSITPVNDAPVAAGDTFNTDGELTIEAVSDGLLGNDADAESRNLTASVLVPPAHGNIQLNADGTFKYTPEAGFSGTDSFYLSGSGRRWRQNDGKRRHQRSSDSHRRSNHNGHRTG